MFQCSTEVVQLQPEGSGKDSKTLNLDRVPSWIVASSKNAFMAKHPEKIGYVDMMV